MKLSNKNLLFGLTHFFSGSPVMIITATISVIVSLIVMIVAVTVVDGFAYEIDTKIKGILSSYQLVPFGNSSQQGLTLIERSEAMEKSISDAGFDIAPFLIKAGMAKANGEMAAIEIKGTDSEKRFDFYSKCLISGRLPIINEARAKSEILISKFVSDKLSLEVGDFLEVIFMEEPPLRERYTVCGIYDTATGNIDSGLVLTDLRNTQYIADSEDNMIGGYDITYDKEHYKGYDILEEIVDIKHSDEGLMVWSTRERFPQLFSWIDLQKSNEVVIISIMMTVGIINVVSLLLIMLLQNIYQIGLLTILGMKQKMIRKIFIIRSLKIVVRAMIIANILSIPFLALQQRYKFLKLDPDGYSVGFVPVHFDWLRILLLNLLVVVIFLIFMWITTILIGKIKLSGTLKYETKN